MSNIVERLRAYANEDHERGCKGREYDCSCGYDDKRDPLLTETAATTDRLLTLLKEADVMIEGDMTMWVSRWRDWQKKVREELEDK